MFCSVSRAVPLALKNVPSFVAPIHFHALGVDAQAVLDHQHVAPGPRGRVVPGDLVGEDCVSSH